MISTFRQVKTAADYRRLPEGTTIQLIGGEFIESPSPLAIHQKLSMYLSAKLFDFVMSRNLGEVFHAPLDVHLSSHDVYQPDILFVATSHLKDVEDDGIYGAPDLIIEILSSTTAHYDRSVKKQAYQEFGVKEYWIVDPKDRSIECFVNSDRGFQLAPFKNPDEVCSAVLPGFCVALPDLRSLS